MDAREKFGVLEFSARIAGAMLLTLAAVAWVVLVLLSAGCTTRYEPLVIHPQPPPTYPDALISAWNAECAGLWRFELGRDIDASGAASCLAAREAGQSNEDQRAWLRTTQEWQDHQHPPVQRLHVEGRRFVQADGSPFSWRGVTAFALLEQVAHGREGDADANLQWAQDHGVTVVRVLGMAWNLWRLSPEEGAAALPRLLSLVEAHGLHVELVALADTASYSFDRAGYVSRVGAACAASPACLLEIANEPVHPTQAPEVGDPAYLRSLRGLIPPGVLVALGPAGATIAESDTRFVQGSDYMPIHEERQDDGSGVRWVRHLADLREISQTVNLPVVNDEPRRDDTAADNNAGVGALARVFGLGDTFHSQAGLGALIPSGAELDAFNGRRQGWESIPAEWTGGTYCNAGFAGCPVGDADWNTVVKVYGAVAGDRGYVVAVGVKGTPSIAWGWSQQWLLFANGRTAAWQVAR